MYCPILELQWALCVLSWSWAALNLACSGPCVYSHSARNTWYLVQLSTAHVLALYLGSQTVHLLRQVLSLQEKLILLVEQLHQLLGCGLAVLIQLPESAEKN